MDSSLKEEIVYVGSIAIMTIFMMPSLLTICGIIYHGTIRGSDYPKYSSIWRCFVCIADVFTDILSTILLYIYNSLLFPIAAICIVTTIIISYMTAFYHIGRWSHGNIPYFKQYLHLFFLLTLLIGFFPSIFLLSSKLFYLKPLSLQLSYTERHSLGKFRLMNHIILQNTPFIAIQIYNIFILNVSNPIINMSLFLSTLSIMISVPKWFKHLRSHKTSSNNIFYQLEIQSPHVRHNHLYCHQLIADVLLPYFTITVHHIEVISIELNTNNDGVLCTILISTNEHENNIDLSMMKFADNFSNTSRSIKTLLHKLMALGEDTPSLTLLLRKNGEIMTVSNDITQQSNIVPTDNEFTCSIREEMRRKKYKPLYVHSKISQATVALSDEGKQQKIEDRVRNNMLVEDMSDEESSTYSASNDHHQLITSITGIASQYQNELTITVTTAHHKENDSEEYSTGTDILRRGSNDPSLESTAGARWTPKLPVSYRTKRQFL